MKKIAYIIIPWAISLLFQGCAHDADSEMFDRGVPLVNLNISVALADISQSGTRVSDIYPEPPAPAPEKLFPPRFFCSWVTAWVNWRFPFLFTCHILRRWNQ